MERSNSRQHQTLVEYHPINIKHNTQRFGGLNKISSVGLKFIESGKSILPKMKMTIKLFLLIIVYCNGITHCLSKINHNCCPGENIISLKNRSCLNGENISLECEGPKVPIIGDSSVPEENFVFNISQDLMDGQNITQIRYCIAKENLKKNIYIVCLDAAEESQFDYNKIRIGAFLSYISVTFIIFTIIVYLMVPKLLDLQGICTIHALIGMAFGYTFLGIIQLNTDLSETACQTIAFLTYFFLLYLFFWLNTLSFHIWRTTIRSKVLKKISRWTLIYHVYAIGGTLLFLMLLSMAQFSTSTAWDNIKPGIGDSSCWFQSLRETLIFFYGPISLLLIFNFIFYLWTIMVLWGQVESTENKVYKYRLKLCAKLFIIMGITWVFEIITAVLKDPDMSLTTKIIFVLFDLLNIFQGLIIFLILVVFRKKVRRSLASKNLCNIQFPSSWRYLEDDEMDETEERINCTTAEYKDNNVEIKR